MFRESHALLMVRADASPAIGTGHVMRCLSLAQGWRRQEGEAVFLLAASTPAIERRIAEAGFEWVRSEAGIGSGADAAATIAAARRSKASWIIADGYRFGAEYQRAMKDAGFRLLVFDDYGHAKSYCADLVLNQNPGADARAYGDCAPHTRLLLGEKYVVLREQFASWRTWQRQHPTAARKVLVTLGGADPENVTSKVVAALCALDVEARIVVGGGNPHLAALQRQLADPSSRGARPRTELVVDACNMPELMAWADVAVSAGGSTLWEMAFMGLPSIVILLADNQRGYAELARRTGVGVCLGWHAEVTALDIGSALSRLCLDHAGRSRVSAQLRQLVDGQGTQRVIEAMQSVEAPVAAAGAVRKGG
jgi:UDP-2,4-diacetamido-2,4,6-trideoxy-beta-L-altropyranose hydrolase